MAHWRATLLWTAGSLCAQAASQTIGAVDFYGYGALDPAALRAVLPFHEGVPLPSDKLSARARDALQSATGRREVEIWPVRGSGHWTIYIGLAEPTAPAISFNPPPKAGVALPSDVLKLFKRLDKDMLDALKRGAADDDDAARYTLASDQATRSDKLRLHEWARASTATIYRVLETSRFIDQRVRAAQTLGYADESPAQIAALVRAAFDADAAVRNAAIRALIVLSALGQEVTREISAPRFIPLLYSLHWTDRNRASRLLAILTDSRDPRLLEALREQALPPLREMVRWKDGGHAKAAATILGRIAGLTDTSTTELFDSGKIDEILNAVR